MAGETYYEFAVISQEGIDINNIDYYLQKDTSQENSIIREYYPDRAITPSKKFKTNNRITYYELTQAEAAQINSNPDVYSAYYSLDYILGNPTLYPSFSISTIRDPLIYNINACSTQNNYFSIAADSVINSNTLINSVFRTNFPSVNWGLRWHTAYKDKINWAEMFMLNTSSYQINLNKNSYNYNIDGSGVDLVIVDTGVKYHPEFLDENNNLRIVEYDWYSHLDALDANGDKKILPSNFYTSQSGGHGTHVASIAAGRISGWAKGATIYSIKCLGEGGVGEFWYTGATAEQPQSLMTLPEGLEAIRLFHESKPIDPKTGFKRPTIVNASLTSATNIINQSSTGRFINSDLQRVLYNLYTGSNTGIHQVVYRGNVVQTGSLNLRPSLRYAIKSQYDYNNKVLFDWRYRIDAQVELDELQILCKQMEDAGVIFIRAAGNDQNIITRTFSPDYPQYNNQLYSSSLKTISNDVNLFPANTSIPTNRLGSPYSEKTIVVGSISPIGVIPGSPITSIGSPSSGSFTYNLYGTPNWNNPGLPPYYHGRVTNWVTKPILGIGSGSTFPGWGVFSDSASIALSSFTTIGPAVDIFAAGAVITAAGHPFYVWYNDTQDFVYTVKNYNIYDPNYNSNINPLLDNTDYMVVLSGTSMAAPQIAGIACLYFQMNPGATAKQFKQFLSASAIKTPQMKVFNEDPSNDIYYSGAIDYSYTELDPLGFQRIYPQYVQTTASLALYGTPSLVAHWPYSNPNPFTTT